VTSLSPYASAVATLTLLAPELILVTVATAMMTLGAFVRLPRRTWSIASAVSLGVALVALLIIRDQEYDPYAGVVVNDALAFYARLVFLLAGFLLLGMAHDQVDDARAAEFFGSILMIHAGAMLVASANELVFLFVGLELVSIPTYLLLYLPRRTAGTQEAATKYFFLSIFSSGLLLFGLAYLYGLSGVSNLKALAYLCSSRTGLPGMPHAQFGLIAVVFILAGLGFRVAAVPFHFYAPDVYQGSPTFVAALLAWIPKGLGFVAMLRTIGAVVGAGAVLGTDAPVPLFNHRAAQIVAILAVATMTLGNTVALAQNNLKRLLAYSSIAHAGYLLIGVAVVIRNGAGGSVALGGAGLLYYLVAYALMTLGAFAVIIALNTGDRPVETVDDMAGLALRHRGLAVEMAVCLFSLAGIPPLAGFVGKFELFASAWGASREGWDGSGGGDAWMYQSLAVLGAINSAIGAYYYLRIVVVMFLRPNPGRPHDVRLTWPLGAAITGCTLLTLLVGIFAGPVLEASHEAAVAASSTPDPASGPPAAVTAR
jgi:NADH-quinone oxidoreductase subunit N